VYVHVYLCIVTAYIYKYGKLSRSCLRESDIDGVGRFVLPHFEIVVADEVRKRRVFLSSFENSREVNLSLRESGRTSPIPIGDLEAEVG